MAKRNTHSEHISSPNITSKSLKSPKTSKSAKAAKKTKAAKLPKISPVHKPADMSLEDWQRSLRRQAAATEPMGVVRHYDDNTHFEVRNPKSGNIYQVEYFGNNSKFNRCNCMDFRTNRLGTCKHIEAVKNYKNGKYARIRPYEPEHSSVIVDYTAGKRIRLRLGTYENDKVQAISQQLFDAEGYLRQFDCDPSSLIKEVKQIDPEFIWEEDALNLIISARDNKHRRELLEHKYADSDFSALIKTKLHPYQIEGVKFAFAGGRTINADEMGLGKTVQAIATAELLKREGFVQSVIIICPTSLKYQWLAEIKRFTDSSVLVVEGDLLKRKSQFEDPNFFYKICSFHAATNNVKAGYIPSADMLIFDELQRLKNWDTQMGKQLRKLSSEYVMALSGTPLENKLNELYSVVQFVDQFKLGPLYEFVDSTTMYDESGKLIGYKNLHEVSEKLKGCLIRRRKADVKIQMPARTDTNMFVPMTKEQQAIHDEYKFQVSILIDKWHRFKFLSEADRKRLLLLLSMMRMVCDSTFILDQKTRHDTKIDEVKEIVSNMLESPEGKVVIFSQWERMLRILAQELEKEGLDFCFLHGGVPSIKRKDLIDRFRDDPECRIFLSTDAGATGLNLQTASLVINIDLPWNPAVLEQRIARIYRLGQKNPVQIINMVARDTIEQRMLSTLKFKSNMAAGILDGGEDAVFIEGNKFGKIVDMVEGALSDEEEETLPAVVNPIEETNFDENKADENKADANKTGEDNTGGDNTGEDNTGEDKVGEDNIDRTVTHKGETQTDSKTKEEVRDLVREGMGFIGTLANILKEPEGASKLADALVKEDPDTGKATLNIPVPDKSTVTNLFAALSSLLK